MRLVIKHLFAVATILLLEWLPLSAETTSTISHYIPNKEWNSSTPEEQGMDSKILADAVEYLSLIHI